MTHINFLSRNEFEKHDLPDALEKIRRSVENRPPRRPRGVQARQKPSMRARKSDHSGYGRRGISATVEENQAKPAQKTDAEVASEYLDETDLWRKNGIITARWGEEMSRIRVGKMHIMIDSDGSSD